MVKIMENPYEQMDDLGGFPHPNTVFLVFNSQKVAVRLAYMEIRTWPWGSNHQNRQRMSLSKGCTVQSPKRNERYWEVPWNHSERVMFGSLGWIIDYLPEWYILWFLFSRLLTSLVSYKFTEACCFVAGGFLGESVSKSGDAPLSQMVNLLRSG